MATIKVVVNGSVYDLATVCDFYPMLREFAPSFLSDSRFTKVWAEDLDAANRIRSEVIKDGDNLNRIYVQRHDDANRTYWQMESLFIFTSWLKIPNRR